MNTIDYRRFRRLLDSDYTALSIDILDSDKSKYSIAFIKEQKEGKNEMIYKIPVTMTSFNSSFAIFKSPKQKFYTDVICSIHNSKCILVQLYHNEIGESVMDFAIDVNDTVYDFLKHNPEDLKDIEKIFASKDKEPEEEDEDHESMESIDGE
jgi:hypothetical protein